MAEKILVIEDDANIAELLRLYLEREGFETAIAHDGERGLMEFERSRPELVLPAENPGAGGHACYNAHRQGRDV